MSTQRLTERFHLTGGDVTETEAGPVIKGVLLCGATSRNRRRYKTEAFKNVGVYNGRPVFLNHGEKNASRNYEDKIGTVTNARHNESGLPIGDIALNPEKPLTKSVIWDVKNDPKGCGMSHVADCKTVKGADGWVDVTSVEHVESVDLVIGPATTKGFFEQEAHPVKWTTTQLREWVLAHPAKTDALAAKADKLATLTEAEVLDAPEEGADLAESLAAGFRGAFAALCESAMTAGADIGAAVEKVKALLESHAGVTPAAAPVEAPTPDALIREAKAAVVKVPSAEDVLDAQQIASPAVRGRFWARIAEAAAPRDKPIPTAGRTPTAKVVESTAPRTPQEFAASIRD